MKNDFYLSTSGSLDSINGVASFIRNLNSHLLLSSDYKGVYHLKDKKGVFSEKDNITPNEASEVDVYNRSKEALYIKSKLIKLPLIAFVWLCVIYLRPALSVAKRIKKANHDAVIISNDMFLSFFMRKSEKKLITILHASENPINQLLIYFPSIKGTVFEKLLLSILKRAISNSNAIVTLNSHLNKEIIRLFPDKKVFTIFNGVPACQDINKVTNSDEFIRMVGVGSLTKRKGFDLILDALSNSEILQKKMKIDIYGDGPERKDLELKVYRLNLRENVDFKGNVSNISNILNEYDLFILPSRDEGLPIAILEACACHLPILSTRVGAIPEVFNDDEIIYCSVNVESLVSTLESIAKNEIDLNSYAIKSYDKYLSKLSIEAMWNQYSEILDVVCESNCD